MRKPGVNWVAILVWGLPFATVIAIGATVMIAARAPLSNVPETVSRVAQIQQDVPSPDARVPLSGLRATLRREGDTLVWTRTDGDWPALLQLHLRHPIEAAADQVFDLSTAAGTATVPDIAWGQVAWRVELSLPTGQLVARARWRSPYAALSVASSP